MFLNVWNFSHISRAYISKSKRWFNVKSSTYFHMKTKILIYFQICISVPLNSFFFLYDLYLRNVRRFRLDIKNSLGYILASRKWNFKSLEIPFDQLKLTNDQIMEHDMIHIINPRWILKFKEGCTVCENPYKFTYQNWKDFEYLLLNFTIVMT